MTVNVTPEVASAHKNLEELCEKFEVSVDELCDQTPQSIHLHEFYQCECVPIAVECVDALSKFQSTCSYEEGTAYEAAIAAADDALHQQKRELEADAAQRERTYKAEITAADDALRRQKRELEADAAQRERTYKAEIAAADEILRKQKRELEENATQNILKVQSKVKEFSESAKVVRVDLSHFININPKEFLGKNREPNNLTISYQEALREILLAPKPPTSLPLVWFAVGCFVLTAFALNSTGSWLSIRNLVIGSLICCVIPAIIQWSFAGKKKIIKGALEVLRSAAVEECYLVGKEMQNEIIKVSAEYDRKVNRAHTKKETKDKQAAELPAQALSAHHKRVEDARSQKDREDKQIVESAANAIATYDKRVDDARLRRGQAMVYIRQEYQAFDARLCQGLDEFQSFIDTWVTENAVGALNEIQFQNLNQNGKQVVPHLTRIGSVSVWEFSGMAKVSQHGNTDQNKAQFRRPKRTRPKNKKTTQTEKVNTRTFLPGSVRVTPKTPNQDDPE